MSNAEWLRFSKSVWRLPAESPLQSKPIAERTTHLPAISELDPLTRMPSIVYSSPRKRDPLKEKHPATFAESDIRRLILLFTKKGQKVLDPFLGSGTTAIACLQTQRSCTGIELYRSWFELSRRRISGAIEVDHIRGQELRFQVIRSDSRRALCELPANYYEFMVTSPPYWKILRKHSDKKSNDLRVSKKLQKDYGRHREDLSLIGEYDLFLSKLGEVFRLSYRTLKKGAYACVIVSDFRHGSRFFDFHSDVVGKMKESGFSLQGITVLVHNERHLYPYGLPYSFVPNIHHDYALIFRKSENAGP